ncbi:two component system response regulator [Vibrio sp. S4M6]|uniref:two component system response regulator n=1 Tax=Vibrio sinus TaxID=2946865 RepID=UPI00202A4C48|nr:two component system response regulator [Vibrio sinus]MCL9783984.1 two component system response regulator [Vibrio sinus]
MNICRQKKIRLLVVDDHALISDGIRNLLSPYTGIEVVGQVENGLDAYSTCRSLSPDLILMDLNLPGMRGVDAIRRIVQRWPDMLILCITAISEECKVKEALEAGAKGYVLKKSNQQTLLSAIEAVMKNQEFIDPSLNIDLVNSTSSHDSTLSPALTPRETQILKLISEGLKNREIAETLVISLKTVETHRLNLMRKLEAHNAAELVHWARRIGV